ncbi:polysaccharide deacetylase [Thermococcus sp. 4557]|nr:polysaccharide deacetylase [Thermococcus sp. 4557]
MGTRHLALMLIILAVLAVVAGSVTHNAPYTPPPDGGFSRHTDQNEGVLGITVRKEERKTNNEPPLILVHDVTPYYFEDIRQIIAVLDEYNCSNSTILFVIPVFDTTHYGDEWSLRNHPDFVNYLHELQRRGYRVELHGYGHTYHEFNCSYETANEKLDNATALMSSLGFSNLTLFLPPAWALNNESLRAILEHNLTVVMPNWLILPNGTRQRIWNREYTWYIGESQVDDRLSVALHDYRKTSEEGIPFYLSVHPGVVNYGGGLDFLRAFLRTTCDQKS